MPSLGSTYMVPLASSSLSMSMPMVWRLPSVCQAPSWNALSALYMKPFAESTRASEATSGLGSMVCNSAGEKARFLPRFMDLEESLRGVILDAEVLVPGVFLRGASSGAEDLLPEVVVLNDEDVLDGRTHRKSRTPNFTAPESAAAFSSGFLLFGGPG